MYYFEPNNIDCGEGAHVIVETARGLEYATVVMPKRTVSGSEVVLPLRKLVRIATDNDERRHEENLEKETEAYNMCLSKIEEHRLDMKLVEVEYAFDNSKLLFYFTSEGRVDFRDLVKDLASVFRTRIELRQIGIRDEAKLLGGLGICGRPFCCNSFLPDFVQVSIKMAKEQNLSLNSAKISGACGRLMCCLRYEYDTYLAESAITPKVDAIVETPDGEGVVVESMPLKGLVKVALDKDPTTFRPYHRDDLTVKGHAKGKHKTVGKNARDDAQKQKNGDDNKKKPEKNDKK
ncbi:MAG: stage 0 sporulation family protein [Clostridia bacterium]|nr:stage 0 sporulation family protein [Clostridia bacterium]